MSRYDRNGINDSGSIRRLSMFLDELRPIFTELTKEPISFLGGFFSGVFRLNLSDDPVKSWLDQQTGAISHSSSTNGSDNGRNSGPQSISID
jgi:hypothetical protein